LLHDQIHELEEKKWSWLVWQNIKGVQLTKEQLFPSLLMEIKAQAKLMEYK